MKPLKRAIAGGLIFFTVGLPFLQLVIWSFSNRWFYPGLLPQQWGWRAWQYIFDTAGAQIVGAIGAHAAAVAFGRAGLLDDILGKGVMMAGPCARRTSRSCCWPFPWSDSPSTGPFESPA